MTQKEEDELLREAEGRFPSGCNYIAIDGCRFNSVEGKHYFYEKRTKKIALAYGKSLICDGETWGVRVDENGIEIPYNKKLNYSLF